jgi:hypothetical protein
MDTILVASDKAKLKEVIQRMNAGEKGLHSKIIGPIKVFRLDTLPRLLRGQLKLDLQRKRLKVLKKHKGVLICERKIV